MQLPVAPKLPGEHQPELGCARGLPFVKISSLSGKNAASDTAEAAEETAGRDFPGGSGWESACQCRGHGFEPWSGKIPHATEQLSLCATTTEPAL
ncbi:hypothetical protein J1605_011629 [Eschrichtius robustus]|uniref:Uncharacterized protein n=1 Tax=Eschrichtius robustus TaxID=9764 RepID=A0AB34GNR1_ESCRO|nr:hypothetical protein J1605_011629 [Eschrichtius robustus]